MAAGGYAGQFHSSFLHVAPPAARAARYSDRLRRSVTPASPPSVADERIHRSDCAIQAVVPQVLCEDFRRVVIKTFEKMDRESACKRARSYGLTISARGYCSKHGTWPGTFAPESNYSSVNSMRVLDVSGIASHARIGEFDQDREDTGHQALLEPLPFPPPVTALVHQQCPARPRLTLPAQCDTASRPAGLTSGSLLVVTPLRKRNGRPVF